MLAMDGECLGIHDPNPEIAAILRDHQRRVGAKLRGTTPDGCGRATVEGSGH